MDAETRAASTAPPAAAPPSKKKRRRIKYRALLEAIKAPQSVDDDAATAKPPSPLVAPKVAHI